MRKFFGIRLPAVMLCVVLLLSVSISCGITASAEDTLIDSEVLEDTYDSKLPEAQIGERLDPTKSYEFVESTLFNDAGQKMWDISRMANFIPTCVEDIEGHSAVKLTDSNKSKVSEIYLLDNKRPNGNNEGGVARLPYGNLFGDIDASQYKGIRLWINQPDINTKKTINIVLGNLSKQYAGWWDSTGFYQYIITIPKDGFTGYVYLPFEDFVNLKTGEVLDPSVAIDLIGFKYTSSRTKLSDIYVGELALYREGEAKITDSGPINVGVGYELDEDKTYMLYKALDFNDSTDEMWALTKKNGFTVKTGITDDEFTPDDADTSIKLSTTGQTGYSEIYYWNERESKDRLTFGSLFGTNIDYNCYDGIRMWIKVPEGTKNSQLSFYVGMNGYGGWSPNNYPFYRIVIYGGFEGYINIPFENFISKSGATLNPSTMNFIAFKFDQPKPYAATDIYISNLMLYGEYDENADLTKPIGVELDSTKNYEILTSLTFADASQKMWDETKIAGMTATARITDSKYIPENGKTSVNIHTTGKVSSPNVYYWNERDSKTRVPHSTLFGTVDCTQYEGVRFWIKIGEDNTYSKVTMYLGQMFTGYWPSDKVGFYSYDICIPRGGFEGYVNIPLSYFKNKLGESLVGKSLNFIGFKYNEAGFKESDFWISDISLYRVAVAGEALNEDAAIVPGKDLVNDSYVALADGTLTDDVGEKYTATMKGKDDNTSQIKNEQGGFNTLWVAIPLISLLILTAIILFLILLVKKRKKDTEQS